MAKRPLTSAQDLPSVYERRRVNVRALMATWGGPTSLSRKLGHANGSFLAQIAGPNPRRVISERVARDIESSLNLPIGWLDQDQAGTAPPAVRDDLLALCVQAVAAATQDAGQRPTPAVWGELVALVYEQAVATGRVDEAYIQRLLRLIQ